MARWLEIQSAGNAEVALVAVQQGDWEMDRRKDGG
jgi:hypothetical protein